VTSPAANQAPGPEPAPAGAQASEPSTPPPAQAAPAQAAPAQTPSAPAAPATTSGHLNQVDLRRLWPDVVQAMASLRRATWTLVGQNAQVVGFDGDVLTLGFTSPGLRDQFANGGHQPVLTQALVNVMGIQPRIEAIVDPGAQPGGPAPASARGGAPAAPEPPPARTPEIPAEPPMPDGPPPGYESDRGAGAPRPEAGQQPEPPQAQESAQQPKTSDPAAIAKAREAIRPTRSTDGPPPEDDRAARLAAADAAVHPDDLDADFEVLGGAELLQRELGAQMIEEIRHQ